MAIVTALNHVTCYQYDRPVQLGPQCIRLRPAPHARTHVRSYSLKVQPSEHFINWQQDPYGNYLARLVFPNATTEFRVEVDLVCELKVFNPLDFFLDDEAQYYPLSYDPDLATELAPYLELKESGKQLMKFIKAQPGKREGIISFLAQVNAKLNQSLNYCIRMEPGIQSCEQTLSLGSGSCRDMAWLLCQVLRHCGLAARFTSGYLIQLKQDIDSLDGPSGPEQDFTDLHAWTEVYIPGAGWVGLDPTSGLFAGEGHIPLSCSPNPSNAAPISGPLGICESRMTHEMHVSRIHEDPRVTKPLSDGQWRSIEKLGDQVELDLQERDVRLTMGGEPTFVSLDNPAGEEWNFAALGAEKLKLSDELVWRLKEKLTQGALMHYGQGKWYPGEDLPRWALNCFWRVDGKAVWKNDALLSRPGAKASSEPKSAEKLLEDLARLLDIPSSYILPAHEDAAYYLWKEQRLPIEGDILKADLHEKAERKRLQALFETYTGEPVGYVLPLHYSMRRKRWISNRWKFSGDHLILCPGDSPVGLRLPLASLPHLSEARDELVHELDPSQQVDQLPSREELLDVLRKPSAASDCFANDPNGLISTAICVQLRDAKLHVFLPPLARLEHYLQLICAIEEVASQHKVALVLEGYGPPSDLRLQQLSVTPDPGVVEVNMPPAASWKELKHFTETLYDEARKARLSTEKFQLDGKLVGTGGGNHIVVGGAHPLSSPFLRRPKLLQSMLTFWQNHPALSYLFSAQYIGPTSQAPRIDEARHDSLYELELAFRQIPEKEEVPPWLPDRLFRNILIDLTGNTHRAEFCIDKLYSPDGSRGRLGLLELRGFEMTPHYQLNLLQALLVRATISAFWERPYEHRLIPWGTRLHDKYMLPHYVWEDLGSALDTLRIYGYNFDQEWFRAFLEFRFPRYGSVQLGGVTLELRQALEPWPILGEELFRGGVSRAVDSSVERVQVKAAGLVEGRHVLTCNGHQIPLKPTAEPGVQVGAVRYKAWAAPSSLHPTIPVHSPLVFDVMDTVHGRSLGGCKYHVMHPGGRSYEDPPVNANAAESRRLSRFEAMGHSPGPMDLRPLQVHPDFPHTLDLRRAQELPALV